MNASAILHAARELSAPMDAALGTPVGTVSAAVTVVTALTLILSTRLCGNSRSGAKARQQRKRTVLLTGPIASGKTLMFHQLMFGKEVDTVMSMQPNAIQQALHGADQEEGSLPLNMVDFPGAGQLRDALLRAAADAGAILVVIDAAGDASHLSSAAGLLYDLLTYRPVVEGSQPGASAEYEPPPVLVVAHKSDSAGARTVSALKKELEADMERLKVSRAAFVTHGTDGGTLGTSGGGGSGTGGEGEDDRLLLGIPGQPFSFDKHSPLPVAWAPASSKGDKPQLADVRAFILQHVQ